MTFRTITLIAATVTGGLLAGVFALYSHTIMPGLHHTDDRTFIGSFQAIDRAIVNPFFVLGTFLAPLALTVGSAIANRGHPSNRWVIAAAVGLGIAVAITAAVHLPLNDALKAAGDPQRLADPATVRARFHEARWAAWNSVRTVTSIAAVVCLVWAVFLHGQESR